MRKRLTLPVALGVLAFGSLSAHSTSTKAAQASFPRFAVIHHNLSAAQIGSTSNLTTFTKSFSSGGTTYPYTMVGTKPTSGLSTTIPVAIIPLKIMIGTHTFDGSTKVTNTVNSPLFKTANFGTSLGTTQYIDAFQRSEFWKAGVSTYPGYHVRFGTPSVKSTVTLVIPAGFGGTMTDPSTGKTLGTVDINYLDAQLNALLASYTPNMIPVFLSYNTFATENGGCCVGGYHSATGSGAGAQTYSWTSDTDAGVYGGFANDINATSHELGELVNDPYVNNTVPTWSVPSQPQYGCSNSLEVGDPLVEVNVSIPGFSSYHAQDLAQFSWFARKATSQSLHGYYTFANNFSTYSSSAGC